jgi:hypothetical protein
MGPKGVPNGVYPPSEPRLTDEILAIMANCVWIGPEWSKPVQLCSNGSNITF